jgi:hypothetical protein
VRRSPLVRLLALVIALLGSLAAPTLGVAHGLEHAHVAREHHGDSRHDASHHDSARAAEAREADDHGHDHARVDAAPVTRDIGRHDIAHVAVVPSSTPSPVCATLVVVRCAALTDRALLARPDPGGGPPPALRAPPAR